MFKANRKKGKQKNKLLAKLHASHIYHGDEDDDVFFIKSFFLGLQNISLYSSSSPLGLVLKHTHRLESSEAKEKQKSICPLGSSENCQVVAGL